MGFRGVKNKAACKLLLSKIEQDLHSTLIYTRGWEHRNIKLKTVSFQSYLANNNTRSPGFEFLDSQLRGKYECLIYAWVVRVFSLFASLQKLDESPKKTDSRLLFGKIMARENKRSECSGARYFEPRA